MVVRTRDGLRRAAAPVHESPVNPAERELIDAWIRANDLNQFGDPKRAMYAGNAHALCGGRRLLAWCHQTTVAWILDHTDTGAS